MDSQRWQRIKQLFEAAAELPPEARAKFFQHEGVDDDLRSEVESLLVADESDHSLLDRPAVEHFDTIADGEMIGSRLGAFTIIRKIASGGMGAVYFAERCDGQFEQQVAIKVIRHGMISEESVKRFTLERQLLASLQHPNIARLVDGGLTDSGQPYFAMEYVDGMPLTEYCNSHRLNVDQRLDLFATVCDAVQYAHQNLIVHRDIKPTNIMIDSAGTVKLVDFGIAKLLDEPGDLMPDLTQTRGQVMTPAYASPEQRAGKPVSTSTDVYSLGVVMYELLTGHQPYDLDDLSPAAIEQLIASTPPVKPSARVSEPTDRPLPGAGADSRALRQALGGDLDNICLMALRAEPERRYASAGQLADDLRRYRERLPVAARSSTVRYRLGRFVSRHRAAVAASILSFILLVALTGIYVARLASERDYARTEATKAARIADFLTGLFEAADPNESKGEELTALELLEAGRARISTGLEDQPEVRATMILVLANTFHQLGRLEDARKLFQQVSTIEDIDPDDKARAIHALGNLFYDLGEYDSAEVCYRHSLAINTELHGEFHKTVATDLNDLAAAIKRRAGLDSAEVLFRKALKIRRALLDKDDLDIAHSLNHLGRVLWAQGRYAEAEPLLREGLDIRRHVLGDEHFEVIASRGAMASLFMRTERYPEGIEMYRHALQSMRQLVGEQHPHVAGLTGSLAMAHLEIEDYTRAESLFQQSRAIFAAVLPEDHVKQALAMIGLARIYMATDRPGQAEPLLRRALALRVQHLSKESYETAQTQSLLGECLGIMGREKEAETLLSESLVVLVETLGEDHTSTIRTRDLLAGLRQATKL